MTYSTDRDRAAPNSQRSMVVSSAPCDEGQRVVSRTRKLHLAVRVAILSFVCQPQSTYALRNVYVPLDVDLGIEHGRN
jgi:hypothetical protein